MPDRSMTTISRRRGVTIIDVVVVLVFAAIALVFVAAFRSYAGNYSGRIKCASNLRQIAMAALIYAQENGRQYPRTYYDPSAAIDTTTRGGPDLQPVSKPFDTARPALPVGANNPLATLYLLLRESELSPAHLCCPQSDLSVDLERRTLQQYSNFPDPFPASCSYSFATMFPSPAAVQAGWAVGPSSSIDTPLVADINPGDNGSTGPTHVAANASSAKLRYANSPNHWFEGQHVAYVDAHVAWSPTPFCGRQRPGSSFPDNIYAAASNTDPSTGQGGMVVGQPVDAEDAVLLPDLQSSVPSPTNAIPISVRNPTQSPPSPPIEWDDPRVMQFAVVVEILLAGWIVYRLLKTWGVKKADNGRSAFPVVVRPDGSPPSSPPSP